jgi:hypothetical protein
LRNSSVLPVPMVHLLCCTICDQRSGTKPGQVQNDSSWLKSALFCLTAELDKNSISVSGIQLAKLTIAAIDQIRYLQEKIMHICVRFYSKSRREDIHWAS